MSIIKGFLNIPRLVMFFMLLFSFGFSQDIVKLKTITLDVKSNYFSGYYDRNNNYSYIDKDTLDSCIEKDLHGVLKRVPNLNIVNQGGSTTIFLNGFASNQFKILYRGVDLYDPSTPQGTPYFDTLSLMNVESLELVRGAASSYYGNSAVAGVINVVPSNMRETYYYALYGDSYLEQTVKTGFSENGLTVGVSYHDSKQNQLSWTNDPASKNMEKKQNFELDVGMQVNDKTKVVLFYSDNKLDNEIDVVSWDSITYINVNGFGVTGKMVANHDLYGLQAFSDFEDLGNLEFKYSVSDIKRENNDAYWGISTYSAMLNEIDLKVKKQINNSEFVFGAAKRTEKAETSWFSAKEQEDYSLYSSLSVEDLINYVIGTRYTNYNQDKSVLTYTASLWKRFADVELKLNYATGYRQPSLYERFAGFGVGNPNLKAEVSSLADLSFSYEGIDEVILRSTLFSSVVKDKISYSSDSWSYIQVTSDTLVDGYSLGVDFLGIPFVEKLATNYVYINSRDDAGQSLRVPKQKATFDLLFNFFGSDLSIFYTKVASRKDTASVILPSYQTVDIALVKKFGEFEVFLKGVNIFGENFQEISGYNTLNGAWYGGFNTNI